MRNTVGHVTLLPSEGLQGEGASPGPGAPLVIQISSTSTWWRALTRS
jgi:hypothetical protein